ncbi:MAG: VanZ family protein [Clostridia bacterium]|nr:VanZ family protein [Clostridia bacterium]
MREKKAVLWWVIIGVTMLLIWGLSLFGREMSTAQSDAVQGFLGSLFGEWIYETLFYQNIRKVAHFAEYALLGAEWAGYRLTVRGARRPPRWLLLAAGPLTAVCDEALQFISARAPMVADVLLDCGGYACGAAVVLGVSRLLKKYSAAK